MTEQIPKPEQPNKTEKSSTAPERSGTASETKTAIPTPLSPEDQDFNKSVDQKTEEYEKKVKELEKKFELTGSTGKAKAEVLTAWQINRLRIAAAKKKEEFRTLATEQKASRRVQMLGEVEQNLVALYFPYEKIIDYARGLDKIDDAELVKLEAVMEAMSKMKANPELEKLFLKVLNKEKLNKRELQDLVDKITPVSLGGSLDKQQGINQVFESSQIGAIIGVMDESQRPELMETILEKKNPQEAVAILETLNTVGILSNLQLESLINRGKIPEPYSTQLKLQLEKGELAKKQEEYLQKIDQLSKVNKGRTPENPLSKVVGAPGLMAIMALWGAAVAIVNAKAGHWDSPYFALGTAAAIGGGIGTAAILSPDKHAEYKKKFTRFWSGPDQQKQHLAADKAELQGMLEYQMKQNPYLLAFLNQTEEFPDGSKKNGFQIIQSLVSEAQSKKPSIDFKFEEILAKSGPRQRELLTKAYGAEGNIAIHFKDRMRAIMAGLTALEVDKPEKLASFIQDIKKKQGIA